MSKARIKGSRTTPRCSVCCFPAFAVCGARSICVRLCAASVCLHSCLFFVCLFPPGTPRGVEPPQIPLVCSRSTCLACFDGATQEEQEHAELHTCAGASEGMAEDGNGKPYRGTRPFEVCLATPCLLHSRPASLTNPTVSVCLLSSCLYMDHVCCIRMWQALVPGKPWTAKYLTVDDVMAKQSRRGPNAQRYKDGAFRPNRPFPEGYSPRSQNAALSLSPRFRDRAGGVYEWAGTMPDYKTTTSNHYCEPHGHEYIVPTRHGLSPRNPVSSVSQSIFGDGYLQFSPRSKVNAGIKLPPLGSINAIGKTAAEPEDPDPPSGKMSTAEQIAYLEVALRHERRMVDATRSRLQTQLRRNPKLD